jgi:CRP/FNR family transcriptional regulator, cyclic AMP receptor protein
MLRKDGKIELLKRVPLFSQCSKKQLSAIAGLTDLVTIPPGTNLIREGSYDRDFMLIVDGGVDVRRKGRKINTLGPGDYIGEIALLSGGARVATVTTTADTTLLVVGPRAFRDLLDNAPALQVSLIGVLASRLHALSV